MKNLLFVFSFLFAQLSFAQGDMTQITAAIKAGNIDALGNYFDNNVEITSPQGDDLYAKADAVSALKRFFNGAKPASCDIVHKGASDVKDSQYAIGSMSLNGKKYRIYIYLKQSGAAYRIRELRFENE